MKVLTDIERLCSAHIPRWRPTPGMGPGKLAAYTRDPIKATRDALAASKAYRLRSLATDRTLLWRLRRGLRLGGRPLKWSLRTTFGRPAAVSFPSVGDAAAQSGW